MRRRTFLFYSFFLVVDVLLLFLVSSQLAVIKASVYANDGFMTEKSRRSATEATHPVQQHSEEDVEEEVELVHNYNVYKDSDPYY